MDEIRIARLEGKDLKFFKQLNKLDLLIIDDFGMKTIEGQQQNNFEKSYLNHAQSERVSPESLNGYPPEKVGIPSSIKCSLYVWPVSWQS